MIIHIVQPYYITGFSDLTRSRVPHPIAVMGMVLAYPTNTMGIPQSKIWTIILPWGKYSYLRIPMGVACSPGTFQAKMSELMGTLEFV